MSHHRADHMLWCGLALTGLVSCAASLDVNRGWLRAGLATGNARVTSEAGEIETVFRSVEFLGQLGTSISDIVDSLPDGLAAQLLELLTRQRAPLSGEQAKFVEALRERAARDVVQQWQRTDSLVGPIGPMED